MVSIVPNNAKRVAYRMVCINVDLSRVDSFQSTDLLAHNTSQRSNDCRLCLVSVLGTSNCYVLLTSTCDFIGPGTLGISSPCYPHEWMD